MSNPLKKSQSASAMRETEKNANEISNCNKIDFRKRLHRINCVVNDIERHLKSSQLTDSKVLRGLRMDDLKKQRLTALLEQAEKENKQLLNILQQRCNETELSRTNSRSILDHTNPYSSISTVNLQYKYEELSNSHQGLLRILETKVKEIKAAKGAAEESEEKLKSVTERFEESRGNLEKMCDKYVAMKRRKNEKITALREELQSVKEAHEAVIKLLERQMSGEEERICKRLQKSAEPKQAIILQEVKRTNFLRYENMRLKIEVETLRKNAGKQIKCTKSLPNVYKRNLR